MERARIGGAPYIPRSSRRRTTSRPTDERGRHNYTIRYQKGRKDPGAHRSIGDSGNRTSRHSDTGWMESTQSTSPRKQQAIFLSASSGNTPQVRESICDTTRNKQAIINQATPAQVRGIPQVRESEI